MPRPIHLPRRTLRPQSCRVTVLAAMALLIATACSGRAAPDVPLTAPAPTPAATVDPQPVLAPSSGGPTRDIPLLATREALWSEALVDAGGVLPLGGDLDARRRAAQAAALAAGDVRRMARDEATGAALRAEVFQVRPLLHADLTDRTAACRTAECYRVEIYNYATNATTIATIDVGGAGSGADARVVAVETLADTQPEVPKHLADLAADIARRSPEVVAALGAAPDAGAAVMPNVKTALNGSRCERSRHLCVAPTFIQGERALWAIVDLTDGRLVGTRWTDLGRAGAAVVTEQGLQDEVVMAQYCQREHRIDRDGWTAGYVLTPSDGLELTDVRFNGRAVMRSAKLVDWHVSYSGTDGFGYSDAIGCPKFSTASVVAFDGPQIEDIREGDTVVGFAVVQDFRSELWPAACNYRYVQRYELYRDGRFRVGGANLGRGCGNQGTYRPVLRIDVTAGADGGRDTVAQWDGAAWQPWDREGWRLDDADAPLSPDGFGLRIAGDDGRALLVAPNRGQLGDGSRGDEAWYYVTHHEAAEGDGDLLTIGPCCNSDHRQGPEKFMVPAEAVAGTDVVLWVVPQLQNSDVPGSEYCWADTVIEGGRSVPRVFPCPFGPLFVPTEDAVP